MAQLLGYYTVNGDKAKSHKFFAEVETQDEIEVYRVRLEKLHNKPVKKNTFLNDDHKCKIYFALRKLKHSKLHP